MKSFHTRNCVEIKESPLVRIDKLNFDPSFLKTNKQNTVIACFHKTMYRFNRVNVKKSAYNIVWHILSIQQMLGIVVTSEITNSIPGTKIGQSVGRYSVAALIPKY